MDDNIQNAIFKKALTDNNELLKKYDLKNPFLTDDQKIAVEAWYQLPIGIFTFIFFSCFVFLNNLTVLEIILYSYLITIIIAIINWKFYFKPFILLGYIFGGNISSIISIIFAIYFGFNHNWILMTLALADSLGLLGIISPSTWLYAFFSINKIHPKYIFASKYFKITTNHRED
jgi:hypothetical protein